MNSIYKYGVEISSEFVIEMPVGAKVLDVQCQGGTPQLWAIVDKGVKDVEKRSFSVVGTGHEFNANGKHFIGTFQMERGTFIGHLFEN